MAFSASCHHVHDNTHNFYSLSGGGVCVFVFLLLGYILLQLISDLNKYANPLFIFILKVMNVSKPAELDLMQQVIVFVAVTF